MRKETMPFSKAKAIAEEARQALFDAFKRFGHPIEVGQLDGDGRVITKKRLTKLHRAIDEAGLQALGTRYTIIENQGKEHR